MDWRRESGPHFTEAVGECLEGIEAAGSSALSLGEYFRIQRLRDQGSFRGDVETQPDWRTVRREVRSVLPSFPRSPLRLPPPSLLSLHFCPT